jgi:hypothetical protein
MIKVMGDCRVRMVEGCQGTTLRGNRILRAGSWQGFALQWRMLGRGEEPKARAMQRVMEAFG